tara:strand:- start:5 stop:205 length:201 start_codon:yes stop_codon:yes gene_type:complete
MTNSKFTKLQQQLHNQLSMGLKITQMNNKLFIDFRPLNTKTLVSYILKQYPKSDYRLKLKDLITII